MSLVDNYEDLDDPAATGRLTRLWWVWTLLSAAGCGVALLTAGVLLSGADLGTELRARACDTSPLPALACFLVAGALGVATPLFGRLRALGCVVVWEWSSLVLTVPVPAAVLLATLPGVLGCPLAGDIAEIGLIGEALTGISAVAVSAAAATAMGAAIAAAAHVTWAAPFTAMVEAPPSIVELAIAEAEALEADPAVTRFHGVDSDA